MHTCADPDCPCRTLQLDDEKQQAAAEVITDQLFSTHAVIANELLHPARLQLGVCPYCVHLHTAGTSCPTCGAPVSPAAPTVDAPFGRRP